MSKVNEIEQLNVRVGDKVLVMCNRKSAGAVPRGTRLLAVVGFTAAGRMRCSDNSVWTMTGAPFRGRWSGMGYYLTTSAEDIAKFERDEAAQEAEHERRAEEAKVQAADPKYQAARRLAYTHNDEPLARWIKLDLSQLEQIIAWFKEKGDDL